MRPLLPLSASLKEDAGSSCIRLVEKNSVLMDIPV